MAKKEYIEREEAVNRLLGLTIANDATCQYAAAALWNINRITAADVVEVVRCGECKQYEPEGYPEGAGRCGWIDSVVEKDFYCAAGEKKERNV